MKFNIIGYKSLATEDLENVCEQLRNAKDKLSWKSEVKKALYQLRNQLLSEINRRERSKKVWVEFSCYWNSYSYNSSASHRKLGVEYRRLDREIADKLPNYYYHRFSDGSTNDWSIKIVDVKGKEEPTCYNDQIDKFLKRFKEEK